MRLPKFRLYIRRSAVIVTAVSLLLLFVCANNSMAQTQKTITGTVTDTKGLPLSGSSIIEKGTSNGTTADPAGKYQLTVGAKAILIISVSGYKTVEIPGTGTTNLTTSLTLDLQQLDNIVVTGYGTQRRKEITSSVVTVNSKDFIKGNVGDPLQLLQGKVAGLQIGRAGGNPNQPFTIRLRGLNTISGDASPLIVIDGVLGGAIDGLDPNDIESIQVLKDASAAAIYGARASAGVIIVSTKTGKGVSKPQVNYTSQVSFEQISKTPQMATAQEYKDLGGQDLGSNTDWLKEVTRTGISQMHNLSFSNSTSGGFSYNASVNYRDAKSILKNASSYDQLNTRVNLSQRYFDNKLVLSGSLALTSRSEDQGYQQSLSNGLYFNPTAPIYDNVGNFYETKVQDRYNPVAINEQNVRDRKLDRQLVNFRAEIRPIKHITLSGTYTLQRATDLVGEYSHRNSYMGGLLVNGWARKQTNAESNSQFDGAITYTGGAKKIKYVVTAGNSYNYQNYQSQIGANSDFITDDFSYNNLAAGQGVNKNGVVPVEGNVAQPQNFLGSSQRESISNAYFVRTNLNFDDSYFLSGTYRREGSSRFGSNNRWGNFWAVSGGLDAAHIFKINADQLKIRAGYGVTGTLPNTFYGYISTLGLTSGAYANGQFISGISPATAYNPDLKWEEKGELNIGLDFGFFKRLSGSFDYFIRNTKDLLNVVDVPSPPSPVSQQLLNVGNLKTNGVELQLSYVAKHSKDFNWTIDGNFSTAKTVLVEYNSKSDQTILRGGGLAGAVANGGANPIWTIKGEEIGQIYAQPFVRYNPNGDPIVLSKDNQEMVYSAGAFQDNAIRVASALPKFYAGFGNTLAYKKFDLNIFFRGAFGHSLVNEARAAFENISGIGRSNVMVTKGEFDKSITIASYSTRYVEDASFVKLDNVTIAYNLQIKNQKIIRSIRFYATGQNLLTFTKYKGVDPEVRYFDPPNNTEGRRGDSFSGNGLFPGIDRYITFPPTRIYTLGINISL
jgi:TonB-linked SusC/RagA family outer membrane protein